MTSLITSERIIAMMAIFMLRFVMELLDNEYHLIGPVSVKPNGCPLDCEGKVKDRKVRKTFVDRDENSIGEPRFHSTRILANERNNADYRDTEEFDTEELLPSCDCNDISDIRNDRQQRITEIREIERRDERAEPVPGPSRDFVRIVSPIRRAKKPRLEDRIMQRADENGEETTTEEDMDCTCDTNGVTQITREPSRRRPLDRPRIVRNGERRENGEDEENEDEEDEQVEEEDEDAEDSAYRELRARGPRRRRNTARERELKRWIRRCRRECEQRRAR
ncbi:nucleolin-like isoform X1 [Camponotus floridanus]|uniref:nucleolin-like isoform X1 n=1 Tax=Camponotus floridanus TaxID=104421 RepID=UPI000DC6BFB8|nr:nucleolin-like isoform X1 [Camponotus floridanus]